jgi:hypothetical protein
MDRGLEHLLLAVGLPKKLGCKVSGFAVGLKRATVGLELEQLLWWNVHLQPFPEIHLFLANRFIITYELPSVR